MCEYVNTTCEMITMVILAIGFLELLDVQKAVKRLRYKNKLPCRIYYTGKDSHLDFKVDGIFVTDEYIQFMDCDGIIRFKLDFADDIDYYSYQEDGWMLSNDSKQQVNDKLNISPSMLYGFHVDLSGKVDKLYTKVCSSKNRY